MCWGSPFPVVPIDVLGVVPDQEGCFARQDDEEVLDRHLEVELGEDRELETEQPTDLLQHRAGGHDEAWCADGDDLAAGADLYRRHPPAGSFDPLDAPLDHLDSGRPRFLELEHAQLLTRKPATTAGVQYRHGVR